MGRYIRGVVDQQLSLGTLAAKVVVGVVMDNVVNERTLVSSIVASYSLRNMTQTSDVGPIMVGLAHGDYSDAEIEAWLENTGSWNEGAKVEQEIAKRLIRIVGTFGTAEVTAGGIVLADGEKIKTKLNWIVNQGQTLKIWYYNLGGQPLGTTVPVGAVEGHANLWPGK